MEAHSHPPVVHRGRTFLSTLVLGASGIVVTLAICATVVVVYGLNIADRKTDTLLGTVEAVVAHVPEIREALPPVLADALDDERAPTYLEQVEIFGELRRRGDGSANHETSITVHNRGSRVVTLLSLRVSLLDDEGRLIASWNEWAATPIAAEDWRGPLLPGATRRLHSGHSGHRYHRGGIPIDGARVEIEVSDLRVWKGKAMEIIARGEV